MAIEEKYIEGMDIDIKCIPNKRKIDHPIMDSIVIITKE